MELSHCHAIQFSEIEVLRPLLALQSEGANLLTAGWLSRPFFEQAPLFSVATIFIETGQQEPLRESASPVISFESAGSCLRLFPCDNEAGM